jgi:hypothetical protein
MGPDYLNQETNIFKTAHKILKLKRRDPVETPNKEVV